MYRYFIVQNKLLHHFVAKLFEKQRTNFYYNWLSFIEDFLRSLLVCFLWGTVYKGCLVTTLILRSLIHAYAYTLIYYIWDYMHIYRSYVRTFLACPCTYRVYITHYIILAIA